MKQNQLYRLAIVGVLWLSIGVGCQKDPPEAQPTSCRDGTCCGVDKGYYRYAESYENVPVTLTGPYGGWFLEFKKPLPTVTAEPWITAAEVCSLTLDNIVRISQQRPDETFIKCRVWGRLYTADEIPTFTIGVPRFFAIDRIEVIE